MQINNIQNIQILLSIIIGSTGLLIAIFSLLLSIFNYLRDKSKYDISILKTTYRSGNIKANGINFEPDYINLFLKVTNIGRRSGMIKYLICYSKKDKHKTKIQIESKQMLTIAEKQTKRVHFIINYDVAINLIKIKIVSAEGKKINIDKNQIASLINEIKIQKNEYLKPFEEHIIKVGKEIKELEKK